jgi:uncharacterized protein YkwD
MTTLRTGLWLLSSLALLAPAGCGFCGGLRLRDDGDWPRAWALLEEAMLEEVNARRGQGAACGDRRYDPAPPLAPRPELARAARHHSLDMIERDYFDHCSPEGCDVDDRIRAAGWPASDSARWSEDIARAAATAAEAAAQLMASPEHCQNIMSAASGFVGIGYAAGDPPGEARRWTLNFADGAPR